MKKVLIVTAERTGNGHKSSANAVEKTLRLRGYDVKQIDAFTTAGRQGIRAEDAYLKILRKRPFVWKIAFTFSQIFPFLVHFYVHLFSHKKMEKVIAEYQPDIIITNHEMFARSICWIIKRKFPHIKHLVTAIDLTHLCRTWYIHKADYIFVPTHKTKEQLLRHHFRDEQLVVSGFPIRDDIIRPSSPKQFHDRPNVLIVNPALRVKKALKIIKALAPLPINPTLVCGSDEDLYQEAIKLNIPNMKVYQYVNNMNELLKDAHLLISKAGPNMILESLKSGTPVIVTDHVFGLETRHYQYLEKYHYGLRCEDSKKLAQVVNDLITSQKLNQYLNSVLNAKDDNGAEIIANKIDEILKA